MSRRIGDNELAFLRREKSIGHIYGDTLFAFGGQTVNQQGKINFLTLGAGLFAVCFQCSQLVLKNHLAVV